MAVPYDEVLAARLRELAPMDMKEKNVFGARCWIVEGNMAFGVHDDDLLVRLGGKAPGAARPFDPMGQGRPMKGWYLVDQDELAEDEDLRAWMDQATSFARGLPPK